MTAHGASGDWNLPRSLLRRDDREMRMEHSLKKKLSAFIILIAMLMACQTVTPLPAVTTARDAEFTLAPDQTAMIDGTSLTIRLIGVGGDQRCPSEIECAISGPVSISLSVQTGSGDPTSIDLQTFTDNNDRTRPTLHNWHHSLTPFTLCVRVGAKDTLVNTGLRGCTMRRQST